jgi:hypothetical protein
MLPTRCHELPIREEYERWIDEKRKAATDLILVLYPVIFTWR